MLHSYPPVAWRGPRVRAVPGWLRPPVVASPPVQRAGSAGAAASQGATWSRWCEPGPPRHTWTHPGGRRPGTRSPGRPAGGGTGASFRGASTE